MRIQKYLMIIVLGIVCLALVWPIGFTMYVAIRFHVFPSMNLLHLGISLIAGIGIVVWLVMEYIQIKRRLSIDNLINGDK